MHIVENEIETPKITEVKENIDSGEKKIFIEKDTAIPRCIINDRYNKILERQRNPHKFSATVSRRSIT